MPACSTALAEAGGTAAKLLTVSRARREPFREAGREAAPRWAPDVEVRGGSCKLFHLVRGSVLQQGERDGAGPMVGEPGPQPRTRSLMHARQDGVWINN